MARRRPGSVRRLESTGGPLSIGDPVTIEGREVGTVTSAAGTSALALLGRAVDVGAEVSVGDTTATVHALH